MPAMRFLVVSLGSIGTRHLRCLRRLHPEAHITVWRHRHGAEGVLPAEADAVVTSREQALAVLPEAAIIASPAIAHLDDCTALVEAGIPVLVEKPLAASLAGTDLLRQLAQARGVPVVVGYVLRFHPIFQTVHDLVASGAVGVLRHIHAEVGQFLPDWRPGQDFRHSVSARADLGGGALLELSHEIDMVLALAGRPRGVFAQLRYLGELDLEVEDCVDMVLDYPRMAANIHLDMLQRGVRRFLKIGGADGSIEADFVAGSVRLFRDGTWTTVPFTPLSERDGLYLAEQLHFLDCVAGRATPMVGLDDGIAVLDVVEAARRSQAEGRQISL